MKQVVVTNVFGPMNRGDHELFKVLIEKLEKYDLKISAIARDPELCSTYFPNIQFYEQLGKCTEGAYFQQILSRVIYLILSTLTPFFNPLKYLLPDSQRKALDAISQADLVISCPGGFLEDSTPSLYTHLVQLLASVLFGKRIVMAPMSIGPIKAFLPKNILKFILLRVDAIFVREPISEKFCQQLGVSSKISDDLAFVNSNLAFESIDHESNVNCIVATVINWNFPNSNDSNAARNKYIDSMSETLNNLHASTNLPVKLIVQVENDLPAIEKVRYKLNMPCEIMYGVNTPEKIKELLGASFCLIASRFHSAIFSLSVGCPVIALSYLPKTSGMLDLYGLSDLHRPIDNFDPQEVASSLKKIASDRQKFIARTKELFTSIIGGESPFLMYIDSKLSSN